MSLMAGNFCLAEEKVSSPQLRPLIGAFELSFGIQADIRAFETPDDPATAPVVRWLVIHSARITAHFAGGHQKELGQAMLDRPELLRQQKFGGNAYLQPRIILQPSQLGALEDWRNGGNLDFQLQLYGFSGVTHEPMQRNPETQTLRITVAQSDWVAQLNSAQSFRVLLLEVAMPFVGASAEQNSVDAHLRTAQKHFVNGNYSGCMLECRKAAEDLKRPGHEGALARLSKREERELMDKDNRAHALLAAIENYAHPAAHSTGSGGADFVRSEAKLALSLAVAFAAHRLNGN